MNCVTCDRPAHGICRFCGRGLCKDHFVKDNYVQAIYPANSKNKKDRVLVVENVIKCNICRPVEELVELDLD